MKTNLLILTLAICFCATSDMKASLPEGGWVEECEKGRMDGTTMTADCPNDEGDMSPYKLDVSTCKPPVTVEFFGGLECMDSEEEALPTENQEEPAPKKAKNEVCTSNEECASNACASRAERCTTALKNKGMNCFNTGNASLCR